MHTQRASGTKQHYIWQGILPVVIYYGLMMAMSVLLIFIMLIQMTVDGPDVAQSLLTGDFVMWAQVGMSLACFLIFLPLFRRQRREAPRYETPIVRPATVIPVLLGSAALWFVVAILVTPLVPFFPSYEVVSETLTEYGLLVTILSAGVLAPLVEELCFRGLVWNNLRRAMPFWPSILLQAVIFGAIHMNPLQAIYAGVTGACFCLLYARHPSIVLPILAHFVFNMTNYVLPLVADMSTLSVLIVSGMVLLLCVLFLLRLPKPKERIEAGYYCLQLGRRTAI